MKPIVIYGDESSDTIVLKKKDFERYLNDAHTQGYTEGFNYARSLYEHTPPPFYVQYGPGDIQYDQNKITITPNTPYKDSITTTDTGTTY